MSLPDNDPANPRFAKGQRVRMLPCENYPPIKGVRYGIIQGATQLPGMYLINEPRQNEAGEWAYIVASYAHPKAGAMWWSANGLEPMKRLEPKPCHHTVGYWINKRAGNFRCLKCGCQYHLRDLPKVKRDIQNWED